MITRILAVALLAAVAAPAGAATIKRVEDRIVLTGRIDFGDDVVFAAAAADRDVKTLVLGSHGGDVGAALSIGETVRARGLDVIVPSSCESACVLIWAAGTHRSGNGSLLVHCPRLTGHSECDADGGRAMVAHLRKMDAPAKIVELQETADANGTQVGPEEWDEPPPPRRMPPPPPPAPRYGPPPGFVPPGWYLMLLGPVPCLPQLIGMPFCI